MENHNIQNEESDTESERLVDMPTYLPTNSKIATIDGMEMSATDATDNLITTITQSTGVILNSF